MMGRGDGSVGGMKGNEEKGGKERKEKQRGALQSTRTMFKNLVLV